MALVWLKQKVSVVVWMRISTTVLASGRNIWVGLERVTLLGNYAAGGGLWEFKDSVSLPVCAFGFTLLIPATILLLTAILLHSDGLLSIWHFKW